ncbi:hypothetical protein ABOM_010009 [Aspergillus bombycis]|uniref:Uncharacterized protein n=1 Tax=Aspergillus bombycis TaxID=109264 RepID=A0A1F7ZN78_9EURO|nr:hypothetical protein ABOM_010009 [Aspergillus bombycis]OGM40894.1 hypothetical protein ABOM_010009 [Aspergillus bombycis]
MEGENSWINLFFSGNPPEFVNEIKDDQPFRPFCSRDEDWKLRGLADKTRPIDETRIQVLWLLNNGHRKYAGKVFPDYTKREAASQLYRLGVSKRQIPQMIDDAVREFDRFVREARAYTQIDRFCSRGERTYFPRFHGVVTDMQRDRFLSGYVHQRAVVLEAIVPKLHSRRILAGRTSQLPEGSLEVLAKLPFSSFERDWYRSLLNDRLRRLDALHRLGVTHGDVQDWHFRLPGDFYDTVLYDFSEAYTVSSRWPFRINRGKPRPLRNIAECERKRVGMEIEERASTRDFRSHLIHLSSEDTVDDALWQSLDVEKESLELIIFKVCHRPDDFSMPTLNSVFPFLEAVCPQSDPGWLIRRGRLLHHYESAWAVSRLDENRAASILFDGEVELATDDSRRSYLILCLIPKSWNLSWRTDDKPSSDDTGPSHQLRQACLLALSQRSGCVFGRSEFLEVGKKPKESDPSEHVESTEHAVS